MTVPSCPLCDVVLDIDSEVELLGQAEHHWYGCADCGRNLCETCAINRRLVCDLCDHRMVRDQRFATRFLPEHQWRERAAQFEADELIAHRLIASIKGDDIDALSTLLPKRWRDTFWSGVGELEVRRRLGILDYELSSAYGEVRFRSDWYHNLRGLWSSYATTKDGAEAELDVRAMLCGIAQLGPNGQFALPVVFEALRHRAPHIQQDAMNALSAISPSPRVLEQYLLSLLSSKIDALRLLGLRALDATLSDRITDWADFNHRPPNLEPPLEPAEALVSQRLGESSNEELRSMIQAVTEDAQLDALRGCVLHFNLGHQLQDHVRDMIRRRGGWLGCALQGWIRALGPAKNALLPDVVERFGLRRSAQLLEEAGEHAEPFAPALEAALWTESPSDALRISKALLSITNDLERAAPAALRARIRDTLSPHPKRVSAREASDPVRLACTVRGLLSLPVALRDRLTGHMSNAALLDAVERHNGAMYHLLTWNDVAQNLLQDSELRPRILAKRGRSQVLAVMGPECRGAQLWLQRLYKKTDSLWTREAIIEALGRMVDSEDSPAALPLVQCFCDRNEDPTLRLLAARALGSEGVHEDHRYAIRAVCDEPSEAIVAAALVLLSSVDSYEFFEAFTRVASPLLRLIAHNAISLRPAPRRASSSQRLLR